MKHLKPNQLYPAKLEKAESSYSAVQISKPPFVNLCRSKFSAIAELTVTGLGIVSLSGGKAVLQRVGCVPAAATFPSSLSFYEHHWENIGFTLL